MNKAMYHYIYDEETDSLLLNAICTGQRPLRHSSAATWPSAAATLFRWQIWV